MLLFLQIIGWMLISVSIVLGLTIEIGLGVQILMTLLGSLFVMISGILLLWKKFYTKASPAKAFVRTSSGTSQGDNSGLKIFKDGGGFVIPMFHEIIWVDLRTFKLTVTKIGAQALLTSDKLRVDIIAEFYVKVKPDDVSIIAAARSFGDRMEQKNVMEVVEEKLVSALRAVATKQTLEALNSERQGFIEQVQSICRVGLEENGLTLEDCTISKLDQTDSTFLNENNLFDAQGLRTIAEITEAAKTRKNLLIRQGEEERKKQDVETQERVLVLEQQREKAEAEQAASVARIKADQNRSAKEKEIEASKAIELAQVAKEEATDLAKKQQEQLVLVAEQKKVEAIEVAQRKKEAAIALAEKERAEKQAQQAEAEKIRQQKLEEIRTVSVVEEANRAKRQQIISAEAEAERRFISEQKTADAAAYKIERDAAARKSAADADAEATRKKAEADKDAEIARAAARESNDMVPVKVKGAEVDVDKRRIEEVVLPELRARTEFGQSAQEFELAQLYIKVQQEIEIERAKASVAIFSKVEVQAYTTLDQMTDVQAKVLRGQGFAGMINGFRNGLDSEVTAGAIDAVRNVVDAIRGPKEKEDEHSNDRGPRAGSGPGAESKSGKSETSQK